METGEIRQLTDEEVNSLNSDKRFWKQLTGAEHDHVKDLPQHERVDAMKDFHRTFNPKKAKRLRDEELFGKRPPKETI